MLDAPHAASRPRILNVNDTEGARYMTTAMLRRAGFEVFEADTGEAALAAVARLKPQLVVLDVQLPDISGIEVCRRLRENLETASIKVLHTSATFVTTEKKVESLDGGADGYLTQPFEPEELIATVKSLLRLSAAEEDLRQTAQRLREEDRRKNEFLAMLAHELRNPLAAIAAALPTLAREQPRGPNERRVREVIQRQTAQLGRLIDDLLDVARVTTGKIALKSERVDLSNLLASTVENARQAKALSRRQTIALELPIHPVYVFGDGARLEQVLANLIDNACKYTPEGGNISCELVLQASPDGQRARILVRDDGIGIAAETLPHVFALFSQADVPLARSSGGLGIGLTLAQALVELHGGIISASSGGLGKGSTFEVALPICDDQSAAPSMSDANKPRSSELRIVRPLRVLLIEDNEDLQDLLAAYMSEWGHEVRCASDGVSGLNLLLTWQPDVALVDIGLPGLDGYELARRVRSDARGRNVLMIAVTGYGAPESQQKAQLAGFEHLLVKPVDPARLHQVVNATVQRRELPPAQCLSS